MLPNSRRNYTPKRPPGSPFNKPEVPAEPAPIYAVDDRVTHDRYGLGTVIAITDGREITVDFGAQTIRIALPSSKLSHL